MNALQFFAPLRYTGPTMRLLPDLAVLVFDLCKPLAIMALFSSPIGGVNWSSGRGMGWRDPCLSTLNIWWRGFKHWWKKLTGRNGEFILTADKSFSDYNFEQQAMIVQDYYSGWVIPLKETDKLRELTADEKRLIETMLKNAGLLK